MAEENLDSGLALEAGGRACPGAPWLSPGEWVVQPGQRCLYTRTHAARPTPHPSHESTLQTPSSSQLPGPPPTLAPPPAPSPHPPPYIPGLALKVAALN